MDKQNKLILHVVERFLYHKKYVTNNPIVIDFAKKMCELEMYEMWLLTQ